MTTSAFQPLVLLQLTPTAKNWTDVYLTLLQLRYLSTQLWKYLILYDTVKVWKPQRLGGH